MRLLLVFCFAAVSANVELFGGFEGPFAQFIFPSFIRDANSTVQQEWQSICHSNGTMEAQEQSQTAFGQKYGLTARVAEYQKNQTNLISQLSQNISAIIANLTVVKENALNIIGDKKQTRQAMLQQLVTLSNTYGESAEALFAIAKIAMTGHGHRGMPMMGAGPMTFPTMPMGAMPGGAPPPGFPNFQVNGMGMPNTMGAGGFGGAPAMSQPFGVPANFQG